MQRNAAKSDQEAPPEIRTTGPPQGAHQERKLLGIAGKAAPRTKSHERGLYQGIININKETAAHQENKVLEIAGQAAHHTENQEKGLYQRIINIKKEITGNHQENIQDPPNGKHQAKESQPPLPAPPIMKPIKEK